MAYVRRLVSEQWEEDCVIRRYEVETPRWCYELPWLADLPKLQFLELRISRKCAEYFRKVPYSVAETIWLEGLDSICGRPFCCFWEVSILYYPRELEVGVLSGGAARGPIVLEVTLSRDQT